MFGKLTWKRGVGPHLHSYCIHPITNERMRFRVTKYGRQQYRIFCSTFNATNGFGGEESLGQWDSQRGGKDICQRHYDRLLQRALDKKS